MQRHAIMLDRLLTGDDVPSGSLIHDLRDAITERTATAVRDVRGEVEAAHEAGRVSLEWEDAATRFEVLMARMNGLAQIIGPDLAACDYTDTHKHAVPDPVDWWIGLEWLSHGLRPYLDMLPD